MLHLISINEPISFSVNPDAKFTPDQINQLHVTEQFIVWVDNVNELKDKLKKKE